MDIFFTVIGALCALLAFCVSLVKFMHFFQLNSYRASLHFKWIRTNVSKHLPNIVFGGFGIWAAASHGIFAKIVFCALMLLGALFSVPKKAKKPLVYTARVKRMLVTSAVLYAVLLVIAAQAGIPILGGAVLFVLSPLAPAAANFVNTPIEKSVNNYYINDAKKMLSSSNAKVIGITGSYGKTSVKYYLSALLKAKYNVLMTPESYNTPMGIVKTIRGELNSLHEIFVCEMGAKRVGEIKEICDIVHPDMGVITSVGPQHLETFKSIENVKKTKFELADAVEKKNGMLFLNGDDENIKSYKGARKCVTYSLSGSGDYNAEVLSVGESGTTFTLAAPGGESGTFTTKLIGTHNVLNIAGAAAVAHSLGIGFEQLGVQIKKLKSVPHRLELVNRGKDIIIDDAYNSNPSGTRAALETLSCFDGVKILLTPGMVELGAKQNELNFEFGKNAAAVCDVCILVGRKQTESIREGLESAAFPSDKVYVAKGLSDAVEYAYALNTHGTRKIILLENDLPDNY